VGKIERGGIGSRCLEPGVLVGGVLHDEVEDDADARFLGLLQQFDDIGQCSQSRIHREVVGDVGAAVLERRGVEGKQPYACHAEPSQVLEPIRNASQGAPSVAVRIAEHRRVDGVDDGIAVPERLHGTPAASGVQKTSLRLPARSAPKHGVGSAWRRWQDLAGPAAAGGQDQNGRPHLDHWI
jgi:hypothetical protein